MMSYEDLKKFIAETGYRTLSEIQTHFAGENLEILSMNIVYLLTNNQVRRIKFQKSLQVENEELFYIPC